VLIGSNIDFFVEVQEWLEEEYPTYANGPRYIISNDITNFVVSQHANHILSVLYLITHFCKHYECIVN
jgi:hypothetical protein